MCILPFQMLILERLGQEWELVSRVGTRQPLGFTFSVLFRHQDENPREWQLLAKSLVFLRYSEINSLTFLWLASFLALSNYILNFFFYTSEEMIKKVMIFKTSHSSPF